MSAPTQNQSVEDPKPGTTPDPTSGPDGDSGTSDQDIDTAGTEADHGTNQPSMTATGPSARKGGAPRTPGSPAIDRHR